ncbi:type II toxin-antitoxin system VapC family toxin [Candidatus Microgenomates bacterium]|nr:type II toxin-antitoxin system VapC family toxin [Candidatus Microgenomates bacterium]
MNKILLDTSIIIDHIRQRDKSDTILDRLGKENFELLVSIITHTESYSGKSVWEEKVARVALEKVFSDIQILPLTEDISEKAGEIRANYGTSLADAIIAATALEHNLTLATLNIKDFKNIRGLKLFKN